MKKIVLTAAVALALGGCAQVESDWNAFTTTISTVAKSYTNPVTKADEVNIEIAVDAGIKLLQQYKAVCAAGNGDKNCKANVASIQAQTRNIPALVTQLRGFVDNNQQVNAITVYNQLLALYTNVKQIAVTAGVNVGTLP